jgi:preprotein translocase subunit SecG
MYQVIIVIHVLLGLSIVGLILMQQGKGADAGATFGGGASGSVFGAQGAASFLSRTTAILATLFFITSLGLAWLNGNKTGTAADFMATPAVEKEASDIVVPDTGNEINKQVLPVPAPETNTGDTGAIKETPVPPVEQPQQKSPVPAAPSNSALEKLEVPKADDVKAVEEKESKPAEVKPVQKPEHSKKGAHKKKKSDN